MNGQGTVGSAFGQGIGAALAEAPREANGISSGSTTALANGNGNGSGTAAGAGQQPGGGSISGASATGGSTGNRSNAIDRQLEDDSKKFKKECKILLLGMSIQSFPSEASRYWSKGDIESVRIWGAIGIEQGQQQQARQSMGVSNEKKLMSNRIRRIGQEYNRQADEDYPPEWLLAG